MSSLPSGTKNRFDREQIPTVNLGKKKWRKLDLLKGLDSIDTEVRYQFRPLN